MHITSPLAAIQEIEGLKTLLLDNHSTESGPHWNILFPSWVMPAGTIHCVLTFSSIATHVGFHIHNIDWWQSTHTATANFLTLLDSAIQTADLSASQFLEELSGSIVAWEELIDNAKMKFK